MSPNRADPARPVTVVAYAVHVPGASLWETGGAAVEPMCSAENAQEVLGRKGLLFKEAATRLALCAVHRALGLTPGPVRKPLPLADRTAVVVSSNLGNLKTVCDIALAVRKADFRAVSPLETPNASSNVIASTIAIRFGFTGPNVMLCNGATSGLDAVRLGARLIRAGRAARVVVVGAEPADQVAAALVKCRAPQTYAGRLVPELRAAAACVILGGPDVPAEVPHPAVLNASGVLAPGAAVGQIVPADFDGLVLVPYVFDARGAEAAAPHRRVDLTARLGETYGALGVLQTAAAVSRLALAPSRALVACGDPVEGYAWLSLSAGSAAS